LPAVCFRGSTRSKSINQLGASTANENEVLFVEFLYLWCPLSILFPFPKDRRQYLKKKNLLRSLLAAAAAIIRNRGRRRAQFDHMSVNIFLAMGLKFTTLAK
jgi:hypothetical protein